MRQFGALEKEKNQKTIQSGMLRLLLERGTAAWVHR